MIYIRVEGVVHNHHSFVSDMTKKLRTSPVKVSYDIYRLNKMPKVLEMNVSPYALITFCSPVDMSIVIATANHILPIVNVVLILSAPHRVIIRKKGRLLPNDFKA